MQLSHVRESGTVVLLLTSAAQGCIRRKGASEAAPEAVRQAVGGGCRSGWGRLLSVTNAIEAGTWRQGNSGWAEHRLGALEGGGVPPPLPMHPPLPPPPGIHSTWPAPAKRHMQSAPKQSGGGGVRGTEPSDAVPLRAVGGIDRLLATHEDPPKPQCWPTSAPAVAAGVTAGLSLRGGAGGAHLGNANRNEGSQGLSASWPWDPLFFKG